MSPLSRYGSLLLIALGVFAMVLCGSVFYAGFAARQAVEDAERQALDLAAELTAELGMMQSALRSAAVQETAQRALADNRNTAAELDRVVRSAGLGEPLSVRVYGPALEDIELGAYPLPDFTVLEMLLEARRAGSALPELMQGAVGEVHLTLAERLGDAADGRGVLFVRLPAESLMGRVAAPPEIDYLTIFQGLSDHRLSLWTRGTRPARVEMREPLPQTRLWLEWHEATVFPPAGLREAAITGLGGLALLLLGFRWRSRTRPAAQAAQTARRRAPVAAPSASADISERLPAARAAPPPSRPIPPPPPVPDSGLEPDWDEAKPVPGDEAAASDDGLHLKVDEDFFAGPKPGTFDGPGGSVRPAVEEPEDLVISIDGPDAAVPPAPVPPAPEPAPPPDDSEPAHRELELVQPEKPAAGQEDALAWIPPSPAPLPPDPVDESPALSLDLDEPDLPLAKPEKAAEPAPVDLVPQLSEASESRSAGVDEALSAPPAPAPARDSVVDPRLFTDAGILGRFDDGLDVRSATLIGQGLGQLLAERGLGSTVVARDGRLHGAQLLTSLVQGLRGSGIEVLDIGAVPTPVLNFTALERPDHAGVMVTGSHLPADWNGFHIVLGGEVLSGAGIRELQQRLHDRVEPTSQGGYSEQRVVDRYVEAIAAQVQLERPLKVVADCGNGIAGLVVPRLLSAIGADAIPLYADVDGQFPNHVPDPSQPDNLEDLRLCVRNFRADLGLAFDGDGDRLILVGPENDILWPDRYAMLLARDLLSRQPGAAVVMDALCSPRLAGYVKERGGQPIVSDAGPAGVAARMREADALLGVSFSGHVFLAESWNGLDDGLFAACRLCEVLAADTRDVGEILAELPTWVSFPAHFVPTRPVSPEKILQQLLAAADVSGAVVGSEGGFSIDTGDAWGRVCRSADGTGLLVRWEGADAPAAERLGVLLRQLLAAVDERLQMPA